MVRVRAIWPDNGAFTIPIKIIFIVLVIGFGCLSARAQKYPCLPPDIKPDNIVSFNIRTSSSGVRTSDKVTVSQKLKTLHARCVGGKLVDRHRKQIRFFQLKGCWGNPPPDYLEIQEEQRKALESLKKKFTVVEMTCNSGGTLQRIS